MNVKKDIYAQIYDANMNLNSKMQIFNDNINQKHESYDRVIYDFENNLMVFFFLFFSNFFLGGKL